MADQSRCKNDDTKKKTWKFSYIYVSTHQVNISFKSSFSEWRLHYHVQIIDKNVCRAFFPQLFYLYVLMLLFSALRYSEGQMNRVLGYPLTCLRRFLFRISGGLQGEILVTVWRVGRVVVLYIHKVLQHYNLCNIPQNTGKIDTSIW